MYSPTLGPWMQQDLAGYVDGMDSYQFVGSEPADAVDPLGLHKLLVEQKTVWTANDPRDVPLGADGSNRSQFFHRYLDAATWSGSQVVADVPASGVGFLDGKKRWMWVGFTARGCKWAISGHIKSYQHMLENPGTGDPLLAAATAVFNARAVMHENDVIRKLQSIWSPEVVVPWSANAQAELDNEYVQRQKQQNSLFSTGARYETKELIIMYSLLEPVLALAGHQKDYDTVHAKINGLRTQFPHSRTPF